MAPDDLLDGTPGETLPTAVEEQRGEIIDRQLRPRFPQVPPESPLRRGTDEDHALFVPLAADEQSTFAEIEVSEVKAYDLTQADPGRVHEL